MVECMPVAANLQKILIRHKPSFPPLGKYPVVRSLLCLDGILIYYSVIRSEAFQRIRFGLNADKRKGLHFFLGDGFFARGIDRNLIRVKK